MFIMAIYKPKHGFHLNPSTGWFPRSFATARSHLPGALLPEVATSDFVGRQQFCRLVLATTGELGYPPEKRETSRNWGWDLQIRSNVHHLSPTQVSWLHPDWINSPTSPSSGWRKFLKGQTPGSAAGGSVQRRHERWLVARLSMHQARCRGGDVAMVPPAMGEIYHGQKNTQGHPRMSLNVCFWSCIHGMW